MFKFSHNRQRGFTLIELMIVVVIIGILAALAIPRFMTATTRSKQSEAKGILKQVYTMQHAYRQGITPATYGDNGVNIAEGVPGAFTQIGVEVMVGSRYGYQMVAGPLTFTCTATSTLLDDDASPDVWTINETGALVNTTNDVLN